MAAQNAIHVTVGPLLADGVTYGSTNSGGSAPDLASIVADTATLVADGASPTQGHVNTLNGHVASVSQANTADITLSWNPATVTRKNQIKSALSALLFAIQEGYGGLT